MLYMRVEFESNFPFFKYANSYNASQYANVQVHMYWGSITLDSTNIHMNLIHILILYFNIYKINFQISTNSIPPFLQSVFSYQQKVLAIIIAGYFTYCFFNHYSNGILFQRDWQRVLRGNLLKRKALTSSPLTLVL